MNRVGTIQFDFRMQNERFAQELYGRWEHFFRVSIEKILDEVLTHHTHPGEYIEIETLELTAGPFTEDNFYELFPVQFRVVLTEALSAYREQPGKEKPQTEKTLVELLCYFLLYGSLPWNVPTLHRDISWLFRQVLQTAPAELKRFLQLYGHYTTLQQRIVYQLNDPELEQGIRLMRNAESTFICSYVRFLRQKYPGWEKPGISETNYRHAVWHVVYSWLLTDRSSTFNKKNFLKRTVSNLANHMNISYLLLLRLLTEKTDPVLTTQSTLPELIRLLRLLRNESIEELRKKRVPELINWLERINESLLKELGYTLDNPVTIQESLLEKLLAILAYPDSCRLFLIKLTEKEIIRLIPVIVPRQSDFILSYGDALDKQKEKGSLQGKAGSEFGKLKWMIIFPILLENRGAGFNRKYFVRKVLVSIAARYNLTMMELLRYFMLQTVFARLDKSVRTILEELFTQSVHSYTEREKRELVKLWQQPDSALSFIRQLSGKAFEPLIILFAPDEKEFILHYASALDHYHKQGWLEGKAGSGFRHIKWFFIIQMLILTAGNSFNRVSFTESVLRRIAAHYNLSYMDLLHYVCITTYKGHLPPALTQILEELYRQEQQKLIAYALQSSGEKACYQLLNIFYPEVIPFIHTFFQSIETSSFFEKVNNRTHFFRFLWQILFKFLQMHPDQSFHRDRLIPALLNRMASHLGVKPEIISQELEKQTVTTDRKQTESVSVQIKKEKEDTLPEEVGHSYLSNAGIVLISPFLPRLFSLLGLTENRNGFKDREAKIRAIFILQYAIYGESTFPEHELLLNKLLTGYKNETPLPREIELTEKEKETSGQMIQGAIQNWNKLKNTTIDGFREAFLQRAGILEEREEFYLLTVEQKAYDLLLDTLPWNYKTIRYSWMEKRIEVKWR